MSSAIPAHWRDKVFTRDHLAQFAGCPSDTIYTWLRFSGALGYPMGVTRSNKLWFNRHDLYRVGILGALASLGIGIGPDVISAVMDFAENGQPDQPFTRVNHCRHAAAMVEAKAIWECADLSTPQTVVSPNA